MEDKPGSMALCGDGRLLVAMRNGAGWLDPVDGSFTPWLDLEPGAATNRMNDGRCDPAGRFWVGSMCEDANAFAATGRLHRIDADGTHTMLRDGVGVSNGLAFSPEGDRMYFADSSLAVVWRYRYDPDDGTATDPEVFSEWSGLPASRTGRRWTRRGATGRLAPSGGRWHATPRRETGPPRGTAGGDSHDARLRGCRPRHHLRHVHRPGGGFPQAPGQPLAGGIFAVDAGTCGLPEPRFAGGA